MNKYFLCFILTGSAFLLAGCPDLDQARPVESTDLPKPQPPLENPEIPEMPQPPKPGHVVVSDFEALKFQGNRPSLMVVICSYNNETFAVGNLKSVLDQDYSNFRIYYIDDNSTDKTNEIVRKMQTEHPNGKLLTLIKNERNVGSHVENQYLTVKKYSRPDDVVVILDGDDEFADPGVLTKVAKVYSNFDVWLTYGQYWQSRGGIGLGKPIPAEVIENNSFREYGFVQSHLRSFYAWLLLKVPEEELKYKGRYTNFAGDQMEMFPMSELAGKHIAFIDHVLYNYQQENPISDFRINAGPVEEVVQDIKHRQPLKPLTDEEAGYRTQGKKKVGLLFHATGKYNKFIAHTIQTARRNFLPHQDVKFFVFTDAKKHPLAEESDVVFVHTDPKPWPFGTMLRNENYVKARDLFKDFDYLFASDVDISVQEFVGDEILGELVGTKHPGFNGKRGDHCKDNRYSSFVRPDEGEIYFMGGFFGGSRERFLQLAQETTRMVHLDLDTKGLDPNPDPALTFYWHDESYHNRYLIDHPPTLTLSSSYGYQPSRGYSYPEGLKPRIVLVDKDNHLMHQ